MVGGGGSRGRLTSPAMAMAIAASVLWDGPARGEVLPAADPAPAAAASRDPKAAPAPAVEEDEEEDERALAAQARQLGITAAVEGGRGALLPRQARRIAVALVREARRHGLDPLLVAAVAEVESNFDPFAVSSQGAVGLMQVMPATARWLGGPARRSLRDRALFDFELNVILGTGYLALLLAEFPSVEAALLAYNAGPAGARKLLASGLRPALAAYPRRVLEARRRLAEARAPAAAQGLGPEGGEAAASRSRAQRGETAPSSGSGTGG